MEKRLIAETQIGRLNITDHALERFTERNKTSSLKKATVFVNFLESATFQVCFKVKNQIKEAGHYYRVYDKNQNKFYILVVKPIREEGDGFSYLVKTIYFENANERVWYKPKPLKIWR